MVHFAVERRVNALYTELRGIEARIDEGGSTGEIAVDLRRLDEKIARTRVSASRARELYALRQHASLVADRLRLANSAEGDAGPPRP